MLLPSALNKHTLRFPSTILFLARSPTYAWLSSSLCVLVFRFLFQQFTLPNQAFGSQNFREYTAVPFPTVMLVIVGMVCVARQLSREGEHGTGFELSCLSLRSTFLFGQSIVGFASYCKADHSRTKAFSFFVSSHANASTAVAFTA